MLDEELLDIWLRLTSVIDNQRLAASHAVPAGERPLSFNEAVVCGLLARAQAADRSVTASDLCRHTRILKSQMNAILTSLERKGLICRKRSRTDRRQMELYLLPEGQRRYQEGHRQVRELVGRLVREMGEERVRELLPLLRQAADIFDNMQQEA